MPRAAAVRAGGRLLRTAAVNFFALIASARLRMLADPYVDADHRKNKYHRGPQETCSGGRGQQVQRRHTPALWRNWRRYAAHGRRLDLARYCYMLIYNMQQYSARSRYEGARTHMCVKTHMRRHICVVTPSYYHICVLCVCVCVSSYCL